MSTLPCIVCSRELEPVWDDSDNHPQMAVVAISYGNYGSTQYDPMDGSYLEFNVCDKCLADAGKNGAVLEREPRRQEKPPPKMWGYRED